jgi:hypothetical protein
MYEEREFIFTGKFVQYALHHFDSQQSAVFIIM